VLAVLAESGPVDVADEISGDVVAAAPAARWPADGAVIAAAAVPGDLRPAPAGPPPLPAPDAAGALVGSIAFPPGGAALTEEGIAALRRIASVRQAVDGSIRVLAHADDGAAPPDAMAVARRRALAVAEALEALGVAPANITTAIAPAGRHAAAEIYLDY
jgi:outer membrane protein OmpA-like peptidoglycan-associated protein